MIYSVWNQTSRAYDYYESSQVQKVANTPKPGHIPMLEAGATLDQALWPLPSAATVVGSGAFPKGRIASRSSAPNALEGFSMDSSTIGLIGLGVFAFYLWRSDFLKQA